MLNGFWADRSVEYTLWQRGRESEGGRERLKKSEGKRDADRARKTDKEVKKWSQKERQK